MICFILNIFISIITDAFEIVRSDSKDNSKRDLQFWSHLKKKIRNLFKRKDESDSLQRKTKYRDHLSVFPNRTNALIDYIIRVCIFLFKTLSE